MAVSAAVHIALLVLIVGLSRSKAEPVAGTRRPDPEEQARQVQMVYIPPPPTPVRPPPPPPPPPQPRVATPPPEPTVAPRPLAPPPERAQPVPEDNANAPPEATRSEGEETDQPEGGAAATPAAAAEAAPTMESEAQRIFGQKRPATQPGAGPRATRPLEAYLPDRAEKCVPRATASDSAGAQYGTVVGRIFRGDNGRPLAGAHLQMLGTPFVAFTGPDGEYRFRFDLSLIDNCRTQYVRVSARGYESRLLVLMVGENVRSEDVSLERHGRFGL